jgi:hypothetical protein
MSPQALQTGARYAISIAIDAGDRVERGRKKDLR